VKSPKGQRSGFIGFTQKSGISFFDSQKRNGGECRLNNDPDCLQMTDRVKIEVDKNRPATLHNGPASTDYATLQDAIMAWHRLRPEQARKASIRIIGGQLYAAADIPKLLNGGTDRSA
jgi:hypothetical protein